MTDVATFQVLRAARQAFHAHGGSMAAFKSLYASDIEADDGTFDAVRTSGSAPVGGVLYNAINSYVTAAKPTGLGLSSSTNPTAASVMTNIWNNAANIVA